MIRYSFCFKASLELSQLLICQIFTLLKFTIGIALITLIMLLVMPVQFLSTYLFMSTNKGKLWKV